MSRIRSLIAVKVLLLSLAFFLLSAVAMPKYFEINKRNVASQCRANQIIVETALAVAYAENLAKGNDQYPQKLTEAMFVDGKIPTCPVDGKPIQFDPKTGKAFCPNHIESHLRTAQE